VVAWLRNDIVSGYVSVISIPQCCFLLHLSFTRINTPILCIKSMPFLHYSYIRLFSVGPLIKLLFNIKNAPIS
jgi:hypothetical protein